MCQSYNYLLQQLIHMNIFANGIIETFLVTIPNGTFNNWIRFGWKTKYSSIKLAFNKCTQCKQIPHTLHNHSKHTQCFKLLNSQNASYIHIIFKNDQRIQILKLCQCTYIHTHTHTYVCIRSQSK